MKKIMKTLILFVIAVTSLSACTKENIWVEPINPGPSVKPETKFNYVFQDKMGGYECFRIPAIVKTKNGALLAFAEARKLRSNGDSGDIDLMVRKSEDNGKTWGDMIKIWDDGNNTCGNPVPIVDYETGRVHLLMTWNDGRDKWGSIVGGTGYNTRIPYYTYSDDEGKTWATAKKIENIKDDSWGWYGTGPNHGIQIAAGSKKGRLVSPNYYTKRVNGVELHQSHVVYSDDGGKTWVAGQSTPESYKVGECAIAELPGGKLMLNMRQSEGSNRYYCISEDGGETWGNMVADTNMPDPKCQAGLVSSGNNLFISNASHASERINMTIRMSTDNGKSWGKSYPVYDGPSGYSDLVMISDSKIAILFEGGETRYSEGLSFKVIDINEFK